MSVHRSRRGPFVVLVDVVGISLFAVGVIAWGARLVQFGPHPLTLLAGALVAAVATDFVSGLFHFACDRFGEPDWPVVGKAFIAPFREHHVDPEAITRHGFAEVNGANCFVAAPVVAAAYALADSTSGLGLFGSSFLGSLGLFVLLTNQVHKWSHAREVPRVVAWLQQWGLVLSPQHHAGHHRARFDSNYCITFGWLNPWLDGLQFWTRLERMLCARRACPGLERSSESRPDR